MVSKKATRCISLRRSALRFGSRYFTHSETIYTRAGTCERCGVGRGCAAWLCFSPAWGRYARTTRSPPIQPWHGSSYTAWPTPPRRSRSRAAQPLPRSQATPAFSRSAITATRRHSRERTVLYAWSSAHGRPNSTTRSSGIPSCVRRSVSIPPPRAACFPPISNERSGYLGASRRPIWSTAPAPSLPRTTRQRRSPARSPS